MRLRNLFRPLYVVGRIQNWLYEKRHPDHPWLAPDAIRWLEENLKAGGTGFEWGSGRSTLWFGKRLASLTSIETDEVWYRQVAQQVRDAGLDHIHVRHIPLEHPEGDTYALDYNPLPANPAAILEQPDNSLDLVIVDGWYRPVCARAALPKLKPGGILLIDNTDWRDAPHVHVPPDWPLVHQSRNVLTQTSIWRKPAS
jgi:predicted O-methyltransferase YrrM